jgi:hypothetical protein
MAMHILTARVRKIRVLTKQKPTLKIQTLKEESIIKLVIEHM